MNENLQEERKKLNRPIQRFIFGALVGIFFGLFVYGAIDRGVFAYFAPEDYSNWNNIFWDDWLLRIIAIVLSTGAGSIVAGLITRQKGKIIGIISTIPSILFWFYCLYCLSNNQLNLNIFLDNVMPSSTSELLILLAILINLIVGFFGGWYGEYLSDELYDEFDEKKHSLLGIKWFNYLWYPPVMYFILIEGFYIASYGYETAKILFSLPEYSLSSILINLLSLPAMLGLALIYFAVGASYLVISNHSDVATSAKAKVIVFALIITVVPPISFGLTYLSFYLESLFKK